MILHTIIDINEVLNNPNEVKLQGRWQQVGNKFVEYNNSTDKKQILRIVSTNPHDYL